MPYKQHYDDTVETFDLVESRVWEQRIACCDCGLVHDHTFDLSTPGVMRWSAVRNNRATAQLRRHRERSEAAAAEAEEG